MTKKIELTLVDKILIGLALGVSFIVGKKVYTDVEYKNYQHFKPTPVVEFVKQNKLKTFTGFETCDQYDNLIVQYTGFWNKEFENLPGYTPLDPNLVKSIIIQESGSLKDKDSAFKYDPMQIANQGDYALKVLKKGLENFIPENGYAELHEIEPTPRKKGKWDHTNTKMNAEKSIKFGIRWLIHKSLVFDKKGNPCNHRGWKKAVKRYNGDGTKNYTEKVFNRF